MANGKTSREMKGNTITKTLFNVFNTLLAPMTPVQTDEIIAPGQTLPILGGLQVIASPGHTPDHISFYAPTHKLLIGGDSMRALGGVLKFEDGPVTWNYTRGMQTVREQAALKPDIVVVGHGPMLKGAQVVFPK